MPPDPPADDENIDPLTGRVPFTLWQRALLTLISWATTIAVRLIGTVLANAMVFSGTAFYPYYRAGDAHWHISSMADQVAAGAVMMVEESLLTIGLLCWLLNGVMPTWTARTIPRRSRSMVVGSA